MSEQAVPRTCTVNLDDDEEPITVQVFRWPDGSVLIDAQLLGLLEVWGENIYGRQWGHYFRLLRTEDGLRLTIDYYTVGDSLDCEGEHLLAADDPDIGPNLGSLLELDDASDEVVARLILDLSLKKGWHQLNAAALRADPSVSVIDGPV